VTEAASSSVPAKPAGHRDRGIYILGAILGIAAGILDVTIEDLLLTALFVLASTMLLAALRPEKPWRWIVTVAVFVPILQILAYMFLTVKPYRAQIYESFLGFLTGIAGAYGGSVVRRAIDQLFKK
jgi:cell division protein FtsW (lipid II flippase)